MKTCNKCGEEKPKQEFSKNKSSRDGLRSVCKKCCAVKLKEWYGNNKEKVLENTKKWATKNKEKRKRIRRRSYLKSCYGITPQEYSTLVLAQNESCACCQKKLSADKNLYIDHDHKTGAIRGLLCNNCNIGIGLLGDDLDGVLNAVHYLMRYGS